MHPVIEALCNSLDTLSDRVKNHWNNDSILTDQFGCTIPPLLGTIWPIWLLVWPIEFGKWHQRILMTGCRQP